MLRKTRNEPIRSSANHTNIPTPIRTDFEQRSGVSLAGVHVHFNSDKPAKIGSLAFAQGNEVYLGPGQDRLLNHELGHVVYQALYQVPCTKVINGSRINDNYALEKDADQWASGKHQQNNYPYLIESHQNGFMGYNPVIQRMREQEVVRNTTPMRRGNRRYSIDDTKGYSPYMVARLRNYWSILSRCLAAVYEEDFINHQSVYAGLAAKIVGYGNCGEFANIVYSELALMNSNNYIYNCYMIANSEANGGYDHALTVSSPFELPLKQAEKSICYIDIQDMKPDEIEKVTVLDGWADYSICTLKQFCNRLNPYGAKIPETGTLGVSEHIYSKKDALPYFDEIYNFIHRSVTTWKESIDTEESRNHAASQEIDSRFVFDFNLLNRRDVNDYRTPTPFLFLNMSNNEIEYYLKQPFIDVKSLYYTLLDLYETQYDKYKFILAKSSPSLFKQLLTCSSFKNDITLFLLLEPGDMVDFLKNADIEKTIAMYTWWESAGLQDSMNELNLDPDQHSQISFLVTHELLADFKKDLEIFDYTLKLLSNTQPQKPIHILLGLNLQTALMVWHNLIKFNRAEVLKTNIIDLLNASMVLDWLKQYGQIDILNKITLREAIKLYNILEKEQTTDILLGSNIRHSFIETKKLKKYLQLA